VRLQRPAHLRLRLRRLLRRGLPLRVRALRSRGLLCGPWALWVLTLTLTLRSLRVLPLRRLLVRALGRTELRLLVGRGSARDLAWDLLLPAVGLLLPAVGRQRLLRRRAGRLRRVGLPLTLSGERLLLLRQLRGLRR